jgi:hypothetical protein
VAIQSFEESVLSRLIRRVLADAKDAYVISEGDAKWLLTEGYKPEACGAQMEPQKTIIFVDSTRLAHLASRRRIPVRLGPDFLLANEEMKQFWNLQ